MLPDDPRHGTTRGYHAGCRETCCRRAIAQYVKAGRLARLNGGRAVPALGAQRRIQALATLGWTTEDIRREAGWRHRNDVLRILHGQRGRPCTWLERQTSETIRDVYERLSMRLPEMNRYRRRGITIAIRKGWAPPLAWDDIDDPIETPQGLRPGASDDGVVDAVKIARIVGGEFTLATTPAEKAEVVRRWIAQGRSLAELERNTGWNANRYRPGKEVA